MMHGHSPKVSVASPGRGARASLSARPRVVHAASLFSLQLWAFSELRHLIPPLGERARTARLLFLGLVAALTLAVALSYPLDAFVRLFSTSRPPSVRRRRASIAFAVYLILACLSLWLAEGWEMLDAAYFVAATFSTIGCRCLVPRSVAGKLIASTLSLMGPLAAALLWRDSRATPASKQVVTSSRKEREERSRSVRGGAASVAGDRAASAKTPPVLSAEEEEEEEEEERAARVADAIWAFVGVLMVLFTCTALFLRASRGGEQGQEGGGSSTTGGGLQPTIFNSAYSALLALATVG